jgi:hypothetical protein
MVIYITEAAAPAPPANSRTAPLGGFSMTRHSGIPMMQPATPQPLSRPESVHAAPSPEPTLATVIPAYNEEGSIREMREGLPNYVPQFRFVNDGSPDQTRKNSEGSENHSRPADWYIEGY